MIIIGAYHHHLQIIYHYTANRQKMTCFFPMWDALERATPNHDFQNFDEYIVSI
jgi:hypothetical protein